MKKYTTKCKECNKETHPSEMLWNDVCKKCWYGPYDKITGRDANGGERSRKP